MDLSKYKDIKVNDEKYNIWYENTIPREHRRHLAMKWSGMKSRCYDPNLPESVRRRYKDVEIEWTSFDQFVQDTYPFYRLHLEKYGKKETTIDRINSRGNYSKENCRWATNKQQAVNAIRKRKHYKYRGVRKHRNKWVANISFGRKNVFLGLFHIEEEAARCYDLKSIELHGEFAVTNFKYETNTVQDRQI